MKERGDTIGLINALKHTDYKIRTAAAEALIALGISAVAPLAGVLETGDVYLRRKVVPILAKCRDARAMEALCRALRDDDGYVRLLAMHALEENADARAVAPLIRVAQDPKASVHVQTVLRSVLDRTADTVPAEVLRQAAQMNDSYVLIFAQVDTSCTFTTYNVTSEEADFTQIKQMARQELIRRGLDA